MQLTGQTAILTGVTNGTGPAIARAMAAAGARLCLADPDAAALAQDLGADHLATDPVTAGAVGALVGHVAGTMGAPDLLVVNLCLSAAPRAPETVAEAEFETLTARLIRPVFLTTRAFLPAMRARGHGAILIVVSLPGPARRPRDVWTAAALGWFTAAVQGLAADAAPEGVRVNALLAATDDTPALPRFLGGKATSAPPPPLGRYPALEEAGAAAVFLCSAAAASLTGLCLPLDGGRHL